MKDRAPMNVPFSRIIAKPSLPMPNPDVISLGEYIGNGAPYGHPIYLAIGETWSEIAPGLAAELKTTEIHSHGYHLSMYGIPELHQVASRRIRAEHRLDEVAEEGDSYEVSITWNGTRQAMSDFARLLLNRYDDGRQPIVFAAGPSWDYAGVFGPLGYATEYVSLTPEREFRPSIDDLRQLVVSACRSTRVRPGIIILNAQHNPTAVNWDASFVRGAVSLAIEYEVPILLDDAYYAVHDEGVTPTSSLQLLLQAVQNERIARDLPWLAVRSLGKQFHCSGWGLGLMVASPPVLDLLVNGFRLQHSLSHGGVLQAAMARWLAGDSADAFLAEQRQEYKRKRQFFKTTFEQDLGYPADKIHAGECTSYSLFAVPEKYSGSPESVEAFRRSCFSETGVMLGSVWPWPLSGRVNHLPYLRMFLGPSVEVLGDALSRIASAGYVYDAA
uniref:pyridoxal phosphate-dependent aminotransferase n=1 Tax=Herbidospora sakaeratensis TaxID=564415 RepID=UPI001471FD61|nr:aminotransferase class I/II-fold pyridoxal phosphate-dependent enzyme [Herbidospora sakaeratensis]